MAITLLEKLTRALQIKNLKNTRNIEKDDLNVADYNVLRDKINEIITNPAAIPERFPLTGTNIIFSGEFVYNTATVPGTGDIAMKPQLAKLGIVQKIYHNDVTPPVFSGVADIQIMGTGVYVPGVLNIIYAEWTGPTESRIEYWITQEG